MTKVLKTNKVVPKGFDSKSPIGIRLGLGKIVDGLHLDFVITKKGKNRKNFMVLAINDVPVGFYDMEWSDHVLPRDGMLCMHARLLGQLKQNKHGK